MVLGKVSWNSLLAVNLRFSKWSVLWFWHRFLLQVNSSEQPVLCLNTRVYLQTNKIRAFILVDHVTHASTHTHTPKAGHLPGPQLPSQQEGLLLLSEGQAENHVPSCDTATHRYQSEALSVDVPGHPLVFFSTHLPDLQGLSSRQNLYFPFQASLLSKATSKILFGTTSTFHITPSPYQNSLCA